MAKKAPQFTDAARRRLTELRAKTSYLPPEAEELLRLTSLEAEVRAQTEAERRKHEDEQARQKAQRELEETRRRGEEERKRLDALRKHERDEALAILREPVGNFAPPGEPPEKARRANAILQVARGALVSVDAATAEAQAARAAVNGARNLLLVLAVLIVALLFMVGVGFVELFARRGPSANDLGTMSRAVAEIQGKIEVLYTTSDEECSVRDSITPAGEGKVRLNNCKRVLMRQCTCEPSPTPPSGAGQP